MITQALYIQGCARSGNTLMRELCAAGFANTHLVHVKKQQSEYPFEDFLAEHKRLAKKGPDEVLIASRDKDSSLDMNERRLRDYPNVRILWMLRHPFDVLTSVHDNFPGRYYVEPERYIQSLRLYERFRDNPQVRAIRYEDLVADADATQKSISDWTGLKIAHPFTTAHHFFEPNEKTKLALHSIRPIDKASVAKWRKNQDLKDYLQSALQRVPVIKDLALHGNYDLAFDS